MSELNWLDTIMIVILIIEGGYALCIGIYFNLVTPILVSNCCFGFSMFMFGFLEGC